MPNIDKCLERLQEIQDEGQLITQKFEFTWINEEGETIGVGISQNGNLQSYGGIDIPKEEVPRLIQWLATMYMDYKMGDKGEDKK